MIGEGNAASSVVRIHGSQLTHVLTPNLIEAWMDFNSMLVSEAKKSCQEIRLIL
jgi:hypothetical protein